MFTFLYWWLKRLCVVVILNIHWSFFWKFLFMQRGEVVYSIISWWFNLAIIIHFRSRILFPTIQLFDFLLFKFNCFLIVSTSKFFIKIWLWFENLNRPLFIVFLRYSWCIIILSSFFVWRSLKRWNYNHWDSLRTSPAICSWSRLSW